jgi:hypothetical protein
VGRDADSALVPQTQKRHRAVAAAPGTDRGPRPTPSSAAGDDWWTPTARPAPDVQIDVTGEPFTGTTSTGEVRGFVDAHNHLFGNEAFGGRLICGKVFSEAGAADALKDCPEHYPDGSLALFDYITHGGDGNTDPILDLALDFDRNQLSSWDRRVFNGVNGIAQTAKEATVPGRPLAR